MSDAVQQIKERLDIVDFLRPYLTMVPAGKNIKATCPFHKEKTPSFMISPDRGIWHCFGCGLGGDVIAFLMRYENLDFVEALKILGEKTGVDVGRVGTTDQKQFNVLYDINKAAKDFFKKQLVGEYGKAAIEYLKKRSMTGETAKEFEVGFAPDGVDMITRALTGAGFSMPDIERAGLALKTERGTYIDRFRNRVMFPLYNHFGKVVGFTGRIMPGAENADKVGKYVNSPETPIFNKSKILYGFDRAKNFIRDAGAAVLVEGQMDFIMAWQDGIRNMVATSGTALTVEHLKALRRFSEKLILSFDEDEAGRIATERAIDLAGAADISAKVMKVPGDLGAKDPADIAVAKPGLLKELVSQAIPAMQYYFERYNISERGGDVKKNMRTVLAKIKFLASPVERAFWLKEASRLSGIQEGYLVEEMEAIKVADPHPRMDMENEIPAPEETGPVSRKELIGQRMISLVMNYKDFYPSMAPVIQYLPGQYQQVARKVLGGESIELTEEGRMLLDLVSLRAGFEAHTDIEKAKSELAELFRQLRSESLKEDRQKNSFDIKLAESKGEDVAALLAEKQRIAQEMRQLEVKPGKVL